MSQSRDLMYSVMAVVKKIALKTGNLLKDWVSGAFIPIKQGDM